MVNLHEIMCFSHLRDTFSCKNVAWNCNLQRCTLFLISLWFPFASFCVSNVRYFFMVISSLNVNYDVEIQLLSHAWTHGNCKSRISIYGTEGRAFAHRYSTKYILCILMSLREVMASSHQKKETRTRTLPTKTIFNVHTKWGRKQYFHHHR